MIAALLAVLLGACANQDAGEVLTPEDLKFLALAESEFKQISWEDLRPDSSTPEPAVPDSLFAEITEDGFLERPHPDVTEDTLSEKDVSQQNALPPQVIQEYDKQNIQIPGFAVPIEITPERRVTEFFLVPYFGACLHLPPPPSNQIIRINSIVGVEIERIYEPVWVNGRISTQFQEHELANAGYAMKLHSLRPYTL